LMLLFFVKDLTILSGALILAPCDRRFFRSSSL
jgi:hypothetical protein